MVEAGIDQLTIVLLAHDDVLNNKNRRWNDIASEIIFELEERLNLIDILGERGLMKKAISGYSIGYSYGYHDFSFAIFYHPQYARMGVLVKFSAQALAYYQGQTNLYVYEVLQKMQSQLYQVRCSRVDIALDFINEGINITEIQNQYNNKELKILVMRERNGKIEQIAKSHSIHGITEGSEFQTIYLGNRENPLYMRIYDKKVEQINSKKGSRRSEAEEYDNWIRFELEIKKDYAHDLTEALLNTNCQTEFKELILGFFIQKFYFVTVENDEYVPTPFMQKIIEMKNDKSIVLFKSVNTRNTELSKSFLYILKSSGVITALYKILAIWGKNGLNESIKSVINYIKNEYNPNRDCIEFLKNNGKEYKDNYRSFNDFYEDEVKPELDDIARCD